VAEFAPEPYSGALGSRYSVSGFRIFEKCGGQGIVTGVVLMNKARES
jgi:hypothetical protein